MNTYKVRSTDASGQGIMQTFEADGFYVEDDHLFLFVNPRTDGVSRDTAVFARGTWVSIDKVVPE